MQIGVVNPTYEAQNLNNEARYPHLSSRPTQAPQPPLTTKGDSCADRRTSGYYDDPDEERYTSLKALEDGATGMEVPKAAGDGRFALFKETHSPLTLKALITTTADNTLKFFYFCFSLKISLRFHESCLPSIFL